MKKHNKNYTLLLTKRIKGKDYNFIVATKTDTLYNAIIWFSATYGIKFDERGYHINRIHPDSTETYFITNVIPPGFQQMKKVCV